MGHWLFRFGSLPSRVAGLAEAPSLLKKGPNNGTRILVCFEAAFVPFCHEAHKVRETWAKTFIALH